MDYRVILFEVLTLVTVVGCSDRSSAPSRTVAPDAWQSMLSDTEVPNSEIALNHLRPSGAVGTDACIECHPSQHASYLATNHSQSLRRVADSRMDEPTADFEHFESKRRYQVEVCGDRMIHREFIRGSNGETIAVNEAEITHEIGSGDHAHSYLFQRDGFLLESPLTWYSQTGWALSPGYDPTSHATFDRTVNVNCIYCHAGQIHTQDAYVERFDIQEMTIGCERCHGPGTEHIAFQNLASEQRRIMSDPIVNPLRLSRDASEAICAQCHLQGIVASGDADAHRWDFRPGQSSNDSFTEYQLAGVESRFQIVGHVEQLRKSACYQNTETLTCITCHDPHAHGVPESLPLQRNETCIDCHQNDACGVSMETRVATQNNDCAACHMPRRPTDFLHAALHDHTIGIHDESYQLANLSVPTTTMPDSTPPQLIPIVQDSKLPKWQVTRRHALALHHLATHGRLPPSMLPELAHAQQSLLELVRSGHDDPSVNVTLAMGYMSTKQYQPARALAARAVEQSQPGDVGYIGAAAVLAELALIDQDNASAIRWYRELTLYRRIAGDHVMLGFCENNAGNRAEAIQELEQALRIDPTLKFAHELMIEILQTEGQLERAEAHQAALTAIRAAGKLLPN